MKCQHVSADFAESCIEVEFWHPVAFQGRLDAGSVASGQAGLRGGSAKGVCLLQGSLNKLVDGISRRQTSFRREMMGFDY